MDYIKKDTQQTLHSSISKVILSFHNSTSTEYTPLMNLSSSIAVATASMTTTTTTTNTTTINELTEDNDNIIDDENENAGACEISSEKCGIDFYDVLEENKILRVQKKELTLSLHELQKSLETISTTSYTQLEKDKEALQVELKQLNSFGSERAVVMRNLEERLTEVESVCHTQQIQLLEILPLKLKLNETKNKHNATSIALGAATREASLTKKDRDNIKIQLEASTLTIATQSSSLTLLANQCASAEKDRDGLKKDLESLNTQIISEKKKCEELEANVQRLENRLAEIQSENSFLDRKNNSLSKELMRLSNRSNKDALASLVHSQLNANAQDNDNVLESLLQSSGGVNEGEHQHQHQHQHQQTKSCSSLHQQHLLNNLRLSNTDVDGYDDDKDSSDGCFIGIFNIFKGTSPSSSSNSSSNGKKSDERKHKRYKTAQL